MSDHDDGPPETATGFTDGEAILAIVIASAILALTIVTMYGIYKAGL